MVVLHRFYHTWDLCTLPFLMVMSHLQQIIIQHLISQIWSWIRSTIRLFNPEKKSAFIRLCARTLVEKQFSYFSTKTYVVGTQKNRLSETVLLSTQNICSELQVRKYLHWYVEIFCLSKPVVLVTICKILTKTIFVAYRLTHYVLFTAKAVCFVNCCWIL